MIKTHLGPCVGSVLGHLWPQPGISCRVTVCQKADLTDPTELTNLTNLTNLTDLTNITDLTYLTDLANLTESYQSCQS